MTFSPVPKPTPTRQKKRWTDRRDPKYCAWVRAHRCFVAERCAEVSGLLGRIVAKYPGFPWCQGRSCVMHGVPKGLGGLDRRNILPACLVHNDWQTRTMTPAQYGELLECDFGEEAEKLDARYRSETGVD